MGFLDSFSKGNSREVIGISVTPGVGLEVTILEKDQKSVKNYGRRKIDYDVSKREILDVEQFKLALGEICTQMGIAFGAKKPMAYVVLPNVYFDFIELPADITPEEVQNAILSDAEDFYIFKKEEPVSGYCEVVNQNSLERKRYAYSSFQKEHIDQIKAAVEDCGFQVIGIETNYSASLRGLYTTGLLADTLIDQSVWSAMIINTNSFVMFKMEGKELISYLEVPLAVRGYSTEEAYEAIISNASQILRDYNSSKLFIISQVDEISAEIIKRKIQFSNDIIVIESNKFAREIEEAQLLEVKAALDFNDANSLTLAAIGSCSVTLDFPLDLNILKGIVDASLGVYKVGDKTVTASQIQAACVALTMLIGGVFGGAYATLNALKTKNSSQISTISSDIQNIDVQIAEASKDGDKEEIDINNVIDSVANENVSAISFYDSIATDIPKKVWLTTYYNKDGKNIAIQGIAENIVDVYEYYKNLRIVSPDSDIKLNELKVFANNQGGKDNPDGKNDIASSGLLIEDSDRLYSFEISNTSINANVIQEKDETQIIGKAPAPEAQNPNENQEELSQVMKPVRKRRGKHAKVN